MQQEFLESIINGAKVHCPCCGRYAQTYDRQLHTSICMQLMKLYKLGGEHEYIHNSKLIPPGGSGVGDFSKARYWDLITEAPNNWEHQRPTGNWKLTRLGVDYVLDRVALPQYALVYDDRVIKHHGRLMRISDSIKKKFDYQELMGIL